MQYLAAAGLSLLVVAAVANLLVFSYGRGVVRAALDEGVRAGSRATASAAECQARVAGVLSDLLSGALGRHVSARCSRSDATVSATADVTFRAWAPFVPDWSFTVRAEAVAEHGP